MSIASTPSVVIGVSGAAVESDDVASSEAHAVTASSEKTMVARTRVVGMVDVRTPLRLGSTRASWIDPNARNLEYDAAVSPEQVCASRDRCTPVQLRGVAPGDSDRQ